MRFFFIFHLFLSFFILSFQSLDPNNLIYSKKTSFNSTSSYYIDPNGIFYYYIDIISSIIRMDFNGVTDIFAGGGINNARKYIPINGLNCIESSIYRPNQMILRNNILYYLDNYGFRRIISTDTSCRVESLINTFAVENSDSNKIIHDSVYMYQVPVSNIYSVHYRSGKIYFTTNGILYELDLSTEIVRNYMSNLGLLIPNKIESYFHVDSSDNLYYFNKATNKLCYLNAISNVNMFLAGGGTITEAYNNVPATSYSFVQNSPLAIYAENPSIIYFFHGGYIKVLFENTVSILAGGSEYNYEHTIAKDAGIGIVLGISKYDQKLFFSDYANNIVRTIDNEGNLLNVVGTKNYGSFLGTEGTSTSLNRPSGIYIDTTGVLYISDTYNFRIIRYDLNSRKINAYGNYNSYNLMKSSITSTFFNYPMSISGNTNGDLYIGEKCYVKMYSTSSDIVNIISGYPTHRKGYLNLINDPHYTLLNSPNSFAFFNDDEILISDTLNKLLYKYTLTQNSLILYSPGSNVNNDINNFYYYNYEYRSYYSLLVNQAGEIFASTNLGYIYKFYLDGSYDKYGNGCKGLLTVGSVDLESANFCNPTSMSFGETEDIIYIGDAMNRRIYSMNFLTNKFSLIAGGGYFSQNYNFSVTVNTSATSTYLTHIEDIEVDINGNIYISSSFESKIFKIDSHSSNISIFAGGGNNNYSDYLYSTNLYNVKCLFIHKPTQDLYVSNDGFLRRTNLNDYSSTSIFNLIGGSISLTITSNVQATSSNLGKINSIYVDDMNSIFISTADYYIKKIDSTGLLTFYAGNGIKSNFNNGDKALDSSIGNPVSISGYNNELYFVDLEQFIGKITSNGYKYKLYGYGTSTNFPNIAYNVKILPSKIWIDSSGLIYVTSNKNNKIYKIQDNMIDIYAGNELEYYLEVDRSDKFAVLRPSSIVGGPSGELFMVSNYSSIFLISADATKKKHIGGIVEKVYNKASLIKENEFSNSGVLDTIYNVQYSIYYNKLFFSHNNDIIFLKEPDFPPSYFPTNHPIPYPTHSPTLAPMHSPTYSPQNLPSLSPTMSPISPPTISPSKVPTISPSKSPSFFPTQIPTIAGKSLVVLFGINIPILINITYTSYLNKLVTWDKIFNDCIRITLFSSTSNRSISLSSITSEKIGFRSFNSSSGKLVVEFYYQSIDFRKTQSLYSFINSNLFLAEFNFNLYYSAIKFDNIISQKEINLTTQSSLYSEPIFESFAHYNETDEKKLSGSVIIGIIFGLITGIIIVVFFYYRIIKRENSNVSTVDIEMADGENAY